MISKKINKVSKRICIIFIIVAILGLTSCADNITGTEDKQQFSQVVNNGNGENNKENSGGSFNDGENLGEVTSNIPNFRENQLFDNLNKVPEPEPEPEPEPKPEPKPEKTFPANTYMEIGVPFKRNVRVSYQDTETLDQLWKDLIDRTDKFPRDGNRRAYLKTANTWDGEKGGNFYFDNEYNIRWDKKPEWIMKIFRGGCIVEYLPGLTGNDTPDGHNPKGGGDYNGRWTLAGLYTYGVGWHSHIKTIPMSDEVRNYPKIFFGMGSPNDTKYESMTEYREVGKTEVLVLHWGMALDLGTGRWEVGGKKAWNFTDNKWTGVSYAAQIYMDFKHDRGEGFWKAIKGSNPTEYMGRFKEKGAHQIYKWGFRFAFDRSYNLSIGYSGSGTKW